nr:immunoglobulin heavy chain junction region [Mus musculus]
CTLFWDLSWYFDVW